jgi:hypothetical protein
MTTPKQGASELTREKAERFIAIAKTLERELFQAPPELIIALCEHYLRTTNVAPAVAEPVVTGVVRPWLFFYEDAEGNECHGVTYADTAAEAARKADRDIGEHYGMYRCELVDEWSKAAPPERTAQPTAINELTVTTGRATGIAHETVQPVTAGETAQPTGASEAIIEQAKRVVAPINEAARNEELPPVGMNFGSSESQVKRATDHLRNRFGDSEWCEASARYILNLTAQPNWREPLEALAAKWEKNLRAVGGMDNEMLGIPAGGVREMINALRAVVNRAHSR